MKIKISNFNTLTLNSQKTKEPRRIFARMLSQKLTEQECKEVSGGAPTEFSCTRTKYPTADFRCP